MIPGNTSSQGKYVDPPTSVSGSAGNGQVSVSFTLPVHDGKGTATYVATASPGGATASGAGSPITVSGLSNGTAYTFTVSTISGYGVSATSSPSGVVTPVAPDPCAGSPAAGTVISGNYCIGTTLVRNVSDGCNGSVVQTVEENSTTCGYVPPPVCDGTCSNPAGYSVGPVVEDYSNPFGICGCCQSTVYQRYDKAGCPSLACFMYCFECGSPYC